MSNNKQQERAADGDGSNEEGKDSKGNHDSYLVNKEDKGGMGHGVGNKGGVLQRGQWQRQQE